MMVSLKTESIFPEQYTEIQSLKKPSASTLGLQQQLAVKKAGALNNIYSLWMQQFE